MLHFPILREHIASPRINHRCDEGFHCEAKGNFAGRLDGLLCPQRLWPLPETHSPQKRRRLICQNKASSPSIDEANSFLNFLTCSHLLPWPWRFATMGQQSSGVM
ncbi:Hypothetical protein FKW44_022216 [Caligus rogercresseyi]|uniref:Uncharacterized protein n=1 Tax=Caligus rogercresseyi TaxID=217165 RepID=A0A7T8GSW5_CALRO|nr:Hypothetical protein FKW44_022216 [Caligus rogercresseyi]